MSIEPTGSDILDQYRATSNKLRKRFLRKPNLTEACESFTALGQHCQNEELPSYAGLSYIAAARCEGSLGNISGETWSLMKAGRQFLSAELNNKKLECPSICNENLQAAISCFTHASSRNSEKSPLNICVDFEIIESLNRLDLDGVKEMYLKDAIELSEDSLDTKIFCLSSAANDSIENEDYTSALEYFTEIFNIIEKSPINGARSDVLLDAEISRVFLLLILRPSPHKLTQNLAQVLEKYTWGDKKNQNSISYGISEDLFILLQSIVLTCQSLDYSTLPDLEAQLWKYLNVKQRDLLRNLIKTYV
ncbi:40-kDa huntingtin-associated protein [Onthophagus taurus]|uniref:40-kDa huntingtin-associated protein n=1 Tax=Onthophagus taurus TaxID=166361 RepID=UPI000C1FFCB3|nr:factor VIII intron 22 protein-like [Onthophagus taurus]